MHEDLFEHKVEQFWLWFQARASGETAGVQFLGDLRARLTELGVLTWEVGPSAGGEKSHTLALSPNPTGSNLERIREIVAAAPRVEGWTFSAGKERKEWDRVFKWGESGVEIDARDWRVTLFRYPDGLYEVVFLNPTFPTNGVSDVLPVLDFVVESELGELTALSRVCKIDFETRPSREMRRSAIPLRMLRGAVLRD
jgi:hypothetical protein